MMSLERLFAVTVRVLVAFSPRALAGHENGNGGGGLSCPGDPYGNYLQMLDIWEGKTFGGFGFCNDDSMMSTYLDRALQRLEDGGQTEMHAAVAAKVKEIVTQLGSRQLFLPSGLHLVPPSDTSVRFIADGCDLVGISIYDDTVEQIFVDKSLFDRLSPLAKGALIFHEAVYKYLRQEFAVSDSRTARFITACTFSTGCVGGPVDRACEELAVSDALPPGALVCTREGTEVALSNRADGRGITMTVRETRGKKPPFRTYFNVDGYTIDATLPVIHPLPATLAGPKALTSRITENRFGWPGPGVPATADFAVLNGGLSLDGAKYNCRRPR